MTGGDAGEWFYAGVFTRGGYDPDEGPRVSVVTDDAIADEGDGAVHFVLVTPDRVPEAITVTVYVSENGNMLQGDHETYRVRIGVANDNGGTEVRFRVGLKVDTVDEPDSIVYAEVLSGRGYDQGEARMASVRVRDDD